MTDSDIYWTFVTASKYAGSFYQAMGNAGLAADPNNKRRILAAFPEMVATNQKPQKTATISVEHG
jgi:hypothetical protein